MKSRVIIPVRRTRFDVSAAVSHGDPVFLFEDEYEDGNAMSGQQAIRRIEERLDEIGFTDSDAVVLTGPVALVSLVMAAVTARTRSVNVMIFDARTQTYRLRHLDMGTAA